MFGMLWTGVPVGAEARAAQELVGGGPEHRDGEGPPGPGRREKEKNLLQGMKIV